MRRLLLLVALAALAGSPAQAKADACPTYNAPDELVLDGGTPQSTKLGTQFSADLQVSVAASNGCPITTQLSGIPITFAGPASGPSGTFAASGAPSVLVGTDGQGGASATPFTANMLPGGYQIVASSPYGSVSFSLVNTAVGVPASVKAMAPTALSAGVNARYDVPLKVQVLDANGTPVQGIAVSFSLGGAAAGGSGSTGGAGAAGASFVSGQAQVNVTTDSDGFATSPAFSANDVPGKFKATAMVDGVSSAATFALDNLAGKAPRIEPLVGRQKAAVGASYRHALKVKVLGGNGKPLQGATVTFSLGGAAAGGGGSGGASAAAAGASFVGGSTQDTETTNANGIAASPRFDANTTPGTFTATATVTGATGAASFALDNLAGGAPRIAAVGGAHQSASVDGHYGRTLEVRVRDAHGKPEQGQTVTFTLGSAGGGAGATGASTSAGASFTGGSAQATATTDANGVAVSPPFTANGTAGAFTAVAGISGTTRTASFHLKNRAGAAVTMTAGAGAIQSASIGSRFAVPLAVTVTDKEGNPVAGATVRFSAPAHGASGTFHGAHTVLVKTNAQGIAVAPGFVANHHAGGYDVKASVSGAGAAAFGLVNLA
jgi:hypothetical protein